MLSLLTFLPLLGAIAVIVAGGRLAKTIALITSLATFGLSLSTLAGFNPSVAGYQFVEQMTWIEQYRVGYKLGVDGVSIWLVLLTTFVFPIAIWFSAGSVTEREREYYALMLLMQTATLGVFLALDTFLFYVFWEFALVPMYLLIGIWGGERRNYASLKFFIYTMAASVLMLIAILYMGINASTFDLETLASQRQFSTSIPLFIAFALAFVVKVPLWPFHSWLPDAHVEAPTAGSVVLAAVLLKMGAYGLIRFNLALFPEASKQLAFFMMVLAVIGILYGAAVAFAQSDAKKLIAYSSVSHMGYIVLGIFALNEIGVQGAVLQMVNHGLSTGGLFLIIGFVYDRLHTREMSKMGGLWAKMPVYGTLALIFMLSSVGLPALNGFVGEFTILQGAFQANPGLTAFAAFGMVLAAAYLLTFFQKVFLGEYKGDGGHDEHGHAAHVGHSAAGHAPALSDLNWREVLACLPLVVMCFVIGLYATPFFDTMRSSVEALLRGAGLVVLR
jgi:NADH-quinone oxidoreductase subunit M